MKIKKFVAPSMHVALGQIKVEFGEDAIILNSKRIKNKEHPEWKDAVEVTAAIDKKENKNNLVKDSFSNSLNSASIVKNEPRNLPNYQFGILQKELDTIGERMEFLINHIKYNQLPHLPKILQQKALSLTAHGIDPSLLNSLIEDILLHLKGEELLQSDLVDQKLVRKLKNKLQVTGPVKFNRNQPSVVLIAGPTGVGKTTTVAKLAAFYKYSYSKKVALVSVDSYRIAAIEQLKTFAEIANIHFDSAYDNHELLDKMKKLQSFDLIIIDTAGINPQNMKKMISLKETIRVAKVDEVHLTLSLTTRSNDLKDIMKKFSIIHFTGIILTKLDETNTFGDIFNLAVEFNKPYSYLTFGQNIPDDLNLADRKDLASTILRGKHAVL